MKDKEEKQKKIDIVIRDTKSRISMVERDIMLLEHEKEVLERQLLNMEAINAAEIFA